MKKKRSLPLFAALLAAGVVAVLFVGSAIATSFDPPPDTYVSIAGTETHQTLPISNTSLEPDCTAAELASIPAGGVLWHFLLNGTSADAGKLRAEFQVAGLTVPDVDESANPGPTLHWNVITPTADTLLNFSTDAVGDVLNLSHVCYVKMAQPTIVTDPGDGGKTGDTLNDTATLAGGSTSPAIGGTITFKLFPPSDPTCAGTPVYSQDVTVNAGNGSYSTSPGYVSLVAGTYQWTADYLGDANNKAVSSGCGLELFVTEAGASSVLTEIRGEDNKAVTEVALGSVVHDHATVSSDNPNFVPPEGTVNFNFYKSNDPDKSPCEGALVTSETLVPLVDGEADSADTAALGAGTYGYLVTYTSDDLDKWSSGIGDCEPLTVKQGQLTAATILHAPDDSVIANGTELALGSKVHDTAQIGGQVEDFDPQNALSFSFYGDKVKCEDGVAGGTAVATSGLDAALPNDPRTADTAALTPGSYAFQVSIAGDDNYKGAISACEPFTVKQGQLTAATILHAPDDSVIANGTELALGSKVHDTAQIGGQVEGFIPDNALSFSFYGDKVKCEDGVAGGTAVATSGLDAAAPNDPRTADTAALTPGSYAFQVSIAGDDNYKGAISACEPFTVKKGDLTLRTDIHNAAHQVVTTVPNPSVVHDTATLSGVVGTFNPSLSDITFKFWTNGDCAGDVFTTPLQDTAEGALVARTVDSASLTPGSYSYKAHYAGDGNYNMADFDCEKLTVSAARGKTMGFWGNQNGQRIIAAGFTYTLGNTTGCYINVKKTSPNNTLTILPNTKNGLSLMTMCDAANERDLGLGTSSAGAINNLLAQTLALELNILYVKPPAFPGTFAGQTLGQLGCTPVLGLTTASTVEDTLAKANELIGNMITGGTVVTQQQIGDMNGLLGGCVNTEA